MIAVRALAFAAGAALVLGTLLSAVRTFVVPRGAPVFLTRAVFRASRRVYGVLLRWTRDYEAMDHLMATYAPVTLVFMPVVWITIVLLGYCGMFFAFGEHSLREAVRDSGSSLFTLGFSTPSDLPSTVLAFSEATFGLGLLTLLLAYLPTMYAAFSRREAAVAMLEVQAGAPPTPEELFTRAWRIGWLEDQPALWEAWQGWFIDVEETHTSLGALSYFRSPQPYRSWVTAAGCVLDAAAIRVAAVDLPGEPQAELCLRSGYLALRRIADYFEIPYDPDPSPGDPVSVHREELDAALDRLAALGVPVKEDRDEVWRAFAGWRVNYDAVLVILAGMVLAPPAPWSSDRSLPYQPPPLTRVGRRRVRGGRAL